MKSRTKTSPGSKKKTARPAAKAAKRKATPPKPAAKRVGKRVAKPKVLKSTGKLIALKKPLAGKKTGLFGKFPSWLWSLGIFGSPLVIAVVLWRAFSPAQLPEPPVVGSASSPKYKINISALPTSKPDGSAQAEQPQRAVAQEAPAAPDPFSEALKQVEGKSVGEKMAWWADRIDQARELISSVKPPQIQDTAPLWPASYDCTTFVETVLSLARTSERKDFYDQLLAVRYHGGRYDFFGRNHFPEADWIPNNASAGIIRDVTAEVAQLAGQQVAKQKKIIRKGAWLQAQLKNGKIVRSLASDTAPDWSKDIVTETPYIKISNAESVAGKIPTGTVINLVRADQAKMPVVISHQGFVVQADGKTWIRHSTPEGQLRKDELVPYLKRLSSQGKWPLLGINLNAPS